MSLVNTAPYWVYCTLFEACAGSMKTWSKQHHNQSPKTLGRFRRSQQAYTLTHYITLHQGPCDLYLFSKKNAPKIGLLPKPSPCGFRLRPLGANWSNRWFDVICVSSRPSRPDIDPAIRGKWTSPEQSRRRRSEEVPPLRCVISRKYQEPFYLSSHYNRKA